MVSNPSYLIEQAVNFKKNFAKFFQKSTACIVEQAMQHNILSVSQLNYSVKQLLEVEFGHVWVMGEISNFSQPVSGHWYLTLKDEQAQVRCAMFRMKNLRVNFRPQNGMQVLVKASVSLYEPRGDYQMIIESMQPAGEGLLQQQFEQLKQKLAAEGLFAQSHKKPLPAFVKRLGIITSSSGAALQDILQILERRDPSLEIVIYPTLVQGKEAAADIVKMIELANLRQECDVLIVGRGGGSLEDLWCFNEEVVARAIFHSQLPIISAVGHETDVTITDFVADLRAPTPSAAAELVSRDIRELRRQLQHQADRASLAFDRLWTEKINLLKHFTTRLHAQHPQRHLQRQWQQLTLWQKTLEQQMAQYLVRKEHRWKTVRQRILHSTLPHRVKLHQQQWQKLTQRLHYQMEKQFNDNQQQFQRLCIKLEGLSPLKILARGYSVTQNRAGVALLSTQSIQVGEQIMTRLAQGKIISQVLSVQHEKS